MSMTKSWPMQIWNDLHHIRLNLKKNEEKQKKGKERSLIDRLIKLKDSVCLFIHNFLVPFDNNQAERDLRNVKTKAKVSGCFRTKKGAQTYLTITSYLSTARKHGINAIDASLTYSFKVEYEKVLWQVLYSYLKVIWNFRVSYNVINVHINLVTLIIIKEI